MSKRKLLAVLLAAIMVFALLAACGGGETATPSPTGTPRPQPPPPTPRPPEATPEPNPFPERLHIYGPLDSRAFRAGAETPSDIASWALISEYTGTEIEWTLIPQGADWNMDFNLLIASRNLPDLMRQGWPSVPGGPNAFFQDGVIICLRDLIESNMPNFNQIMHDRNGWATITYNEDNIFFIPEVRKEIELGVWMGPVMRGDWLDRLNLPVPRTLDDLHKTLIAFRDAEPDGQPVWGMSGQTLGTGNTFDIGQLFFPFGIHFRFFQVNGQIRYGPIEPEFFAAMAYLHMLYDDGLIDPDFVAQTRAQQDGNFMNHRIGFNFAPQPTMVSNSMAEAVAAGTTTFKAIGIPWFRLNENSPPYVFHNDYREFIASGSSVAISTQAQEPEKIANFLDFIFSDEGAIITNYGVEGVDWHMVNGQPDILPAFFELANDDRFLRNFGASSTYPSLRLYDTFRHGQHPIAQEAIVTWSHPDNHDISRALPSFPHSAANQATIASVMPDIDTYVTEHLALFLTGQRPLSDIPAFQATLRQMGIQRAIDAMQDGYNIYLARSRK